MRNKIRIACLATVIFLSTDAYAAAKVIETFRCKLPGQQWYQRTTIEIWEDLSSRAGILRTDYGFWARHSNLAKSSRDYPTRAAAKKAAWNFCETGKEK